MKQGAAEMTAVSIATPADNALWHERGCTDRDMMPFDPLASWLPIFKDVISSCFSAGTRDMVTDAVPSFRWIREAAVQQTHLAGEVRLDDKAVHERCHCSISTESLVLQHSGERLEITRSRPFVLFLRR
jgi:hypothetical protein